MSGVLHHNITLSMSGAENDRRRSSPSVSESVSSSTAGNGACENATIAASKARPAVKATPPNQAPAGVVVRANATAPRTTVRTPVANAIGLVRWPPTKRPWCRAHPDEDRDRPQRRHRGNGLAEDSVLHTHQPPEHQFSQRGEGHGRGDPGHHRPHHIYETPNNRDLTSRQQTGGSHLLHHQQRCVEDPSAKATPKPAREAAGSDVRASAAATRGLVAVSRKLVAISGA